ncbi:unnamed protein product, partial [Mesorhabditis spiculigera]
MRSLSLLILVLATVLAVQGMGRKKRDTDDEGPHSLSKRQVDYHKLSKRSDECPTCGWFGNWGQGLKKRDTEDQRPHSLSKRQSEGNEPSSARSKRQLHEDKGPHRLSKRQTDVEVDTEISKRSKRQDTDVNTEDCTNSRRQPDDEIDSSARSKRQFDTTGTGSAGPSQPISKLSKSDGGKKGGKKSEVKKSQACGLHCRPH